MIAIKSPNDDFDSDDLVAEFERNLEVLMPGLQEVVPWCSWSRKR